MMEFTFSRVSACICGALLILVLFNPVMSSYEQRAETENGECCESIGRMFDSFMNSDTDESSVALNILLPDSGTYVSFDGCLMKMENSRGTWEYVLRHPVESPNESYGWEDYLLLTKNGGVMVVGTV